MLVTVKEWLKSVLNYRSYPKTKTGYPFLDHPVCLADLFNNTNANDIIAFIKDTHCYTRI